MSNVIFADFKNKKKSIALEAPVCVSEVWVDRIATIASGMDVDDVRLLENCDLDLSALDLAVQYVENELGVELQTHTINLGTLAAPDEKQTYLYRTK